MDNYRYKLFTLSGFHSFSTTLDRRVSECISPSGLTYYIKSSTHNDELVEGYRYNGITLVEQQCERETTLTAQKILSRKALQRVPRYQHSFLDDYNLNVVVHEKLSTLPNGKRRPRKR